MTEPLQSGSIISYPYLWAWQKQRGETEGRKDRPTCLAIAAKTEKGITEMILLPISSKPPGDGQSALEIPALECRRINLTAPAWITVSEYNFDIAEHSHSYNPALPAQGKLSRGFLRMVIRQFLEQKAKRISRVGQ